MFRKLDDEELRFDDGDQLLLTILKPNHELYEESVLSMGAKKYGLTNQQERDRIKLLNTDIKKWPKELQRYYMNNRYKCFGVDSMNKLVVDWLKSS